ncbi:MAG: glycosyltransferase, partial [Desulfamplus sp.]|nr:glycosyltransferase [Desulfamplus sp.]
KEILQYQEELERYKVELIRHKEHIEWQQANIKRIENESDNHKSIAQSNQDRVVSLKLELDNSQYQYENLKEKHENIIKYNFELSETNRYLSDELNKTRKELLSYQLPHIDIVIVTYNGFSYLPACLETLFASDYPNFSVIVVDNNSADDSVNWIKTNYPNVIVIENKSNEGFGRANLKGIKQGNSPFFALLNNDTKVDQNWLLPLVEVMQKEPECAAACSRLMFMDNPDVMNASGGGMNFVGYGYDHNIFSIYTPDSSNLNKIDTVFFPTAAACLVRRSAFDDIGGFDRSFFMYHEDVDLGWRFHLKGYSIKYVPESVVFHAFGGTSLKSGSMHFRNRLGLRHALRSLLKNYEITTLKKVIPIFCQLGINNFRAGIPTGFFRAIFWNIVMLPDTIINRVRVQRTRKQTDNEISYLIWQDVFLPVQFPDYQIQKISSFIEHYKNNQNDFNNRKLNTNKGGNNLEFPIDIISNANCNLGYGWHPCEVYFGDGHTLYRWTRQRSQLFFWHHGGDALLRLKILGLSGLLGKPRYFTVQLKLSEQNISEKNIYTHNFTIHSDQWEQFEAHFSGEQGAVEVLISVAELWSPDEKFNNRDYRRLGIGIASAQIHYL